MRREIKRLHNDDVELTRTLIEKALKDAVDAQVPPGAVKDAIILELIDFSGRFDIHAETADRLESLATMLRETRTGRLRAGADKIKDDTPSD